MAEVHSSATSRPAARGATRSKKLSTRVDLTPMVDLGFLLITFFIFTTTMSEPTSMKVYLPDDAGDSTTYKQSGALTLLLGKNNIIYYYEGEFSRDKKTIFTATFNSIRDIIISKRKSVNPKDFVVIIKPQKESIYKNTVDALDEMTINDVKHFSIGELTGLEEQAMHLATK